MIKTNLKVILDSDLTQKYVGEVFAHYKQPLKGVVVSEINPLWVRFETYKGQKVSLTRKSFLKGYRLVVLDKE